MRFELQPHPATVPARPLKVWASAERSAAFGDTATLNLWFGVSAPASRFVLPESAQEPARRDGLWRTTCFECFLKEAGQITYQEWNFSPSGDWAAYDFSGPREGMRNADTATAPWIRTEDNFTWWGLGATLAIPADKTYALALSVVLEERDGPTTYWALHHPGERPDFHHPDCFTARLA